MEKTQHQDSIDDVQERFHLIESRTLHRVDIVRIVAHRLGDGGFANLAQLSFGEADQRISVLVPIYTTS